MRIDRAAQVCGMSNEAPAHHLDRLRSQIAGHHRIGLRLIIVGLLSEIGAGTPISVNLNERLLPGST
jgi:hypothetical protein